MEYRLYYWPVPFRGQFIRAILAYAGKKWVEEDVAQETVAFMGPPALVVEKTGFAIAQMPAIAFYLGETLGLLPKTAEGKAMSLKIVNDANDVIDEITLDGGREMWTEEKWRDFLPRLERWMAIFEAAPFEEEAGVAEIVTATLWSTMRERFPVIGERLDEQAPRTAALCRRLWEMPALAKLAEDARRLYGDAYCGGQIERSLRKVLDQPR